MPPWLFRVLSLSLFILLFQFDGDNSPAQCLSVRTPNQCNRNISAKKHRIQIEALKPNVILYGFYSRWTDFWGVIYEEDEHIKTSIIFTSFVRMQIRSYAHHSLHSIRLVGFDMGNKNLEQNNRFNKDSLLFLFALNYFSVVSKLIKYNHRIVRRIRNHKLVCRGIMWNRTKQIKIQMKINGKVCAFSCSAFKLMDLGMLPWVEFCARSHFLLFLCLSAINPIERE